MKNNISAICIIVSVIALTSCNTMDVNNIKGEWICDNPSLTWNLEKKGEIGGTCEGGEFWWFAKGGVLYFADYKAEIVGQWKFKTDGKSLTVSPTYDESKSIVFHRGNSSVSSGNSNAGIEVARRAANLINSNRNYSGMTKETTKNQLGFSNNMFNQIGNGPGYKVYEVDMNDIDCGENISLIRQIYKINNKRQNVEVFAQHLNTRQAEAVAQNLKTEFEKKIGDKMYSNRMTIDIGEGWTMNGFQYFSMIGYNSYAIGYSDNDVIIIVGFSAASMGDFIGIPFGD